MHAIRGTRHLPDCSADRFCAQRGCHPCNHREVASTGAQNRHRPPQLAAWPRQRFSGPRHLTAPVNVLFRSKPTPVAITPAPLPREWGAGCCIGSRGSRPVPPAADGLVAARFAWISRARSWSSSCTIQFLAVTPGLDSPLYERMCRPRNDQLLWEGLGS
jgi:hypothetical protein